MQNRTGRGFLSSCFVGCPKQGCDVCIVCRRPVARPSLQLEAALQEMRLDVKQRLPAMMKALEPIFVTLPKRGSGVSSSVAKYAIHRAVVGLHGWRVRGLHPEGGSWAGAVTEARVVTLPPAVCDRARLAGNGNAVACVAGFWPRRAVESQGHVQQAAGDGTWPPRSRRVGSFH